MALVQMAAFMPTLGHIQGTNRHEEIPFPQRLDAYSAVENPGRFLDACGEERERAALGCRPVVAAATGRPS
jgi:hypothetical protein